MNNITIIILIVILAIIIIAKIYNIQKLEHLTPISDEAIQNLASLYNKDKLTIGSIDVIGSAKAKDIAIDNVNTNTIKANRISLGDKWVLSGGADTGGSNDSWLRILNSAGQYYGGIAASTFYDTSMSNTIKGYIDSQIQANRPNCNWDGWTAFPGGWTDGRDDFSLHCGGGKLTHMYVHDTRPWGFRGVTLPGPTMPPTS